MTMFVAPLVSAALLITIAADPFHGATGDANGSMQQKAAATEPFVRSATECIVRAVTANPHYRGRIDAKIGDLIANSMPTCLTRSAP
jgi:hypothetical protein